MAEILIKTACGKCGREYRPFEQSFIEHFIANHDEYYCDVCCNLLPIGDWEVYD